MRRLLLPLALLFGVGSASAQRPDAVVESAKGTAFARHNETGETRTIRTGDGLFQGEWAVCADGCEELIISICNYQSHVPKGERGKLIFSPSCYGKKGVIKGRKKGESVPVISPGESWLVRPDALVVRWKPLPSPIKLSVKVDLGKTIWGPVSVDGRTGSLAADALDSLKAILGESQRAEKFHMVLKLEDGKGQTHRVSFSLIPEAAQLSVTEKLKAFDDESDRALKAFLRATVLGEHELYGEAVEEAEKALAISQTLKGNKHNIIELTRFAILINHDAYNDERVRQLCESPHLPAPRRLGVCTEDRR